jgi:hypothetical protein
MVILSIDPGRKTGIAFFVNGKLEGLFTQTPIDMIRYLDLNIGGIDLVIIEDSRLTSFIFQPNAAGSKAKGMKVARNIGEVDCLCKLVQAICEERKKKLIQVSPKNKGAKLDADEFRKRTGWEGKTNQHERDAAMVAWIYRNVKQITNK